MRQGPKIDSLRGPAKEADRDRLIPFCIAGIANKISRGGSRVYLDLFGVGIIEWRILYVLAREPGATARAVCGAVDLDKAAASRSLQVLERLGHVTTRPDPADARKRALSLTPSGRALHDRILRVSLQREQRLLEGFDDVERAALFALLKRMHANAVDMDQQEAQPAARPAAPRARRRAAAQVAA